MTPEAMGLRHLGREVKTALELAIVALGPSELVDRLAMAAGLCSTPSLSSRSTAPPWARSALEEWGRWRDGHLQKISA